MTLAVQSVAHKGKKCNWTSFYKALRTSEGYWLAIGNLQTKPEIIPTTI